MDKPPGQQKVAEYTNTNWKDQQIGSGPPEGQGRIITALQT
jgi:hypothetical protein